ncbi:MAG: polysaccharide biosynthesis/export family protein [Sphingomicrobium sp.]
MQYRNLLLGLPGLALALSSCGGGATLDGSSSAVTVARALPAPDATVTTLDFTNYRIGPLDTIVVEVFGAPELARTGAVDAAGNFSMPLIGTVKAGGRTPGELGAQVADLLRGRYLKQPQVSVNVKEARSQTVTVDGSVREPGNYPIIGRMTLQQAIATARGASELADLRKVIIFRTVKDHKMAALFDLKDIRAGRYPDPQIYGSDIVIVGENATRRFLKDFSTSFPSLGSFIPIL